MLFLFAGLPIGSSASIFGDYVRSSATSEKYPSHITITRFSGVQLEDKTCEWKNAGGFELKTDRGNIDLSSYRIAPNAIDIVCAGKQPFLVLNLPPKYLNGHAQEGDVGIWFGVLKDRYGCEGYVGCDKVHVLETYHQLEKNSKDRPRVELEEW